jgi:hypothetical protein
MNFQGSLDSRLASVDCPEANTGKRLVVGGRNLRRLRFSPLDSRFAPGNLRNL